MSGRSPSTWAIFCHLPNRKLDEKSSQDSISTQICNASDTGCSLIHCTTTPVPHLCIFAEAMAEPHLPPLTSDRPQHPPALSNHSFLPVPSRHRTSDPSVCKKRMEHSITSTENFYFIYLRGTDSQRAPSHWFTPLKCLGARNSIWVLQVSVGDLTTFIFCLPRCTLAGSLD